MSQMKKTMTLLSDILQDEAKSEALFKLRGRHAQCLIDFLDYSLLDPEFRSTAEPHLHQPAVAALRRLCEVSVLHPTRCVLSGIRDVSMKSVGGVCDIFQGFRDRQPLCLKTVRAYQNSDLRRLLMPLVREAILWNQLEHPNIVPFYGIFYLEPKENICLVSPWMKNGNIVDYLREVPHAPRKAFIHDIINGLQYLHAENIVHGDLKGRNVLIDDHQNACLTDFGLSVIVTDGTNMNITGSYPSAMRWASPECLEDDACPTRVSDMWAFGCVCYEVLTGMVPFTGCSDMIAGYRLLKGGLPAQLEDTTLDDNEHLNKKLREVVKKCWSIKPEERPGCPETLREIESIPIVRQPQDLEPVTTQKSPSHPGFQLRAPGSAFSSNLDRGKMILEDLYHGNVATSISEGMHIGPSEKKCEKGNFMSLEV